MVVCREKVSTYYHIFNLIEPAKLEDLSCYKTDLQQVFGMLKYRKDKEKLIDYINKNKDYFSNLTEESYDAIKVFLKSEKIIKDIRKDDKTGGINMCQALEELYQDGKNDGRKNVIRELLREGLITVQVAAEKLGIPVSELSSLDQ